MITPKKAIGLQLPIKLGNEGYFATNKDTISQISDNIKNMLMTRPGERRFNNAFGSGVYNLLFENSDFELSKDMIINTVQRNVDQFLNNVNIVDVKLAKDQPENNEKNSIFISITFTFNNTVGNTGVLLTNNKI